MSKRVNLRRPWARPDECDCGHVAALHIQLPGFPGGAVECQGRDCECNGFHQTDAGSRD